MNHLNTCIHLVRFTYDKNIVAAIKSGLFFPKFKDWFPTSTQTAKVVLQYNLSTVYALRGEYEKAGELVRQVKSKY